MSEHPIQGLMTTALENLKDMIDVNTIVGDPIETPDGSTVILPVSRVGFGFAAGGSQFNAKQKQSQDDSESEEGGGSSGGSLPFGGGSGGGVSISPVAFLIVNQHGVKMVHLDEQAHLYERLLDLAPQAVEKIQDLFKSQKGKEDKKGSKKDKESKGKDDDKEDKDEEKPPPMKL